MKRMRTFHVPPKAINNQNKPKYMVKERTQRKKKSRKQKSQKTFNSVTKLKRSTTIIKINAHGIEN